MYRMQDAPPPAPRPFRFKSLPMPVLLMLILGAVFAFQGILMSVIFSAIGGPFWYDTTLDKRGVEARAKPTKVEATGSRVNSEPVYDIHYTFSGADGTPHDGVVGSRNHSTIEAARAGAPFTIEYDPQNPSVARVEGENASTFGWFALIPLAGALIGLCVMLAALPRLSRIRGIYINGTAAKAKVTAISPTSARVNGRRVMRIDYEFQSVFGPVKGHSTTTEKLAAGAEIWILHNPTNPAANVAA